MNTQATMTTMHAWGNELLVGLRVLLNVADN